MAENVDLSMFVPNVHFEQIPIKDLVSNQHYQRDLSMAHVSKTAEHFDPYQINPVKVSRRNGVNYVFNGQHTIEIVAKVSGSRETPVWCMVYDDLNYETEADIFANQMKYSKALLPFEIFKAKVESGDNQALMIKTMVEQYDLHIGGGKGPNTICAVSALEAIYEKYGLEILDKTLYICVSAWEGDPNSFSANMFKGIAKLLVTYNGALNDETFILRVGRVSPKEIARVAKDRRNGSMGYAETLLIYYNKKAKNKLSWAKLYSGIGDDFEQTEADTANNDERDNAEPDIMRDMGYDEDEEEADQLEMEIL